VGDDTVKHRLDSSEKAGPLICTLQFDWAVSGGVTAIQRRVDPGDEKHRCPGGKGRGPFQRGIKLFLSTRKKRGNAPKSHGEAVVV